MIMKKWFKIIRWNNMIEVFNGSEILTFNYRHNDEKIFIDDGYVEIYSEYQL